VLSAYLPIIYQRCPGTGGFPAVRSLRRIINYNRKIRVRIVCMVICFLGRYGQLI